MAEVNSKQVQSTVEKIDKEIELELKNEKEDVQKSPVNRMIQNGPTSFVHPVTGVRVGPYEFYAGNAHQEHENVVEEEQPKGKKKQQKEGE